MMWQDLTSAELSKLDRRMPVLFNIAAIEQHGPHLPLSTDAAIGKHLTDRIESALRQDVLVLPPLVVGCSRHHMDFPGTLSLSPETFLAYATDTLSCAAHWGFRNLVILNSHGGNQAVGQLLVEKVGATYPKANVVLATWWRLASEALEPLNESGPLGVGHACEFETSLMMHIAPDSVRGPVPTGEHYARSHEWADGGMLRPPRASLYRNMFAISGGSGIVGTPSAASAEKGRLISNAATEALMRLLSSLSVDQASPDVSPAARRP